MPYRTNPYTLFGLLPRLIEYTIDDVNIPDRRFRERGALVERASISLAHASAIRVEEDSFLKRIFRKALGHGDVKLSTAGHEHLCENLRDVKAFIDAIEGLHPDVLPPPPPWYANLTDADLSDFFIKIPGMTQNILFITRRTVMDAGLFSIQNKKTGDWIKAGETIQEYKRGVRIIAPVSGKLVKIYLDNTFWDKGQPIDLRDREDFLHIQPLKGSNLHNIMENTYQDIITLVENVLSHPRKYAFLMKDVRDVQQQLKYDSEDLQMFRSYKPKTTPMPNAGNFGPAPNY